MSNTIEQTADERKGRSVYEWATDEGLTLHSEINALTARLRSAEVEMLREDWNKRKAEDW